MLPLVMAAVVMGGIFEALLGVLRLGRYITLVPYSVVSGFMSGIGFIILVLQLGPFLGISTRGGVVESLQTLLRDLAPNPAAIAVGLMTLAVVFLTPTRIRQWVPSPFWRFCWSPCRWCCSATTGCCRWAWNRSRIGSIPEGDYG